MNTAEPVARMLLRPRLRLVIIGARNQRRPHALDGVLLGARRCCGDVDRQRQSGRASGIRKRLPVIAGRGGDQGRAVGRHCSVMRQDSIQRAANLERERRLQGFELEKNIAAGARRQPLGSPERRAENASVEPPRRRADVVDRDQVRDGLAATRISASRAANAERAMTSSIPAVRAASIRSVWTCETKPSVGTADSSGSA